MKTKLILQDLEIINKILDKIDDNNKNKNINMTRFQNGEITIEEFKHVSKMLLEQNEKLIKTIELLKGGN